MCRGILGDVAMRRRSVVQTFIGRLVFPVQTDEKKIVKPKTFPCFHSYFQCSELAGLTGWKGSFNVDESLGKGVVSFAAVTQGYKNATGSLQ